jgi:hypothetical protein
MRGRSHPMRIRGDDDSNDSTRQEKKRTGSSGTAFRHVLANCDEFGGRAAAGARRARRAAAAEAAQQAGGGRKRRVLGTTGSQLVGRWRRSAGGRGAEAAVVQSGRHWQWQGAGARAVGEPGAGPTGAVAAGHGRARRGAEEVELPAHAEPTTERVLLCVHGLPCVPTAILIFLFRLV